VSVDVGLASVSIWRDGHSTTDVLAVEEPLAIHVDDAPYVVLMRTPGEDLDLAAGFLATEGVIDDADDLIALAHCQDPARPQAHNLVHVRLAPGVQAPATIARPSLAGCGVCGRDSIDAVFRQAPPLDTRRAPPVEWIAQAASKLVQPRFDATGGLHGAVICDPDGHVVLGREDVGRHNAVDKVIGACLRADRWPLDGHTLVVSSRAGFEIVHKALMARIAAVVCVGAASSLAHRLAQEGNLSLFSFARRGRFNAHQPPAEEQQ
jgi:FdhD protein